MRMWMWAVLLIVPLAVAGGLVYAKSIGQGAEAQRADALGYVCPLTGEELRCEKCCPLNQGQ